MAGIAVPVLEIIEVDARSADVGSCAGKARTQTGKASAVDLVVIRGAAVHADRIRRTVGEDEERTVALTAYRE